MAGRLIAHLIIIIYIAVSRSNLLTHQFGWPQLRSLVVELQHVDEAIELMDDFPNSPPTLKEVTLRWRVSSPFHIVNYLRLNMIELGSEFKHSTLEKLEHVLLRFSQARFMCLFVGPVCTDTLSFWTRELGKHLPVLFERGAISMEGKEGKL